MSGIALAPPVPGVPTKEVFIASGGAADGDQYDGGGVCDNTGDEPELIVPHEKGDCANNDGEKTDEAGVDGANGEGSFNPCEIGVSVVHDGGASRLWKGGRPSWKASSNNCASQ